MAVETSSQWHEILRVPFSSRPCHEHGSNPWQSCRAGLAFDASEIPHGGTMFVRKEAGVGGG